MKRWLIPFIGLFSSLLFNCATENRTVTSNSLPEQRCDAANWKVGDSWKYQLQDRKTFSRKVVKVEEKFFILDGGGSYHYVHDKKTLEFKQRINSEGKRIPTETDSSEFFDFPLYVGKKWGKMLEGRTTDGTRSDHLATFKVNSYEDVTVPAGTFRAFVIEREMRARASFTSFFWYAPDVKNIIKYRLGSFTGGWRIGSQDYELIQYDLAQ